MSKKLQMLRSLEELADIALTVELKKLADLRARELEFSEKLDALSHDVSARSETLACAQEIDLAARLGADDRWQAWVRLERTRALSQMAGIAGAREEQMEKTRRALGKLDALQSLQKKIK